jgi:phosphoglycerate dehydrogenase-like enzyme
VTTARRVLLGLENEDEAWRLPDGTAEALERDFPGLTVDRAQRDEDLPDRIGEADIYFGWPPGDAVVARGRRLRWIQAPSAGVGPYLTPAFRASGAQLTNCRGVHAIPISEHVLGALIALARGLRASLEEQRSEAGMVRRRYWNGAGIPHELHGRTLGVYGYGLIGREVARRAAAFGMRIVALKRRPEIPRRWEPALLDTIGLPREEPPVSTLYGPGDFDRFLGECDAVVVAAAQTAETEGRFDARAFSRMKAGAWFLNIARGTLVDEAALAEAVRSGRLGGAGLDVFVGGALPRESELYTLDRVILTPHVSGVSRGFWPRALALFRENLRRDGSGEPLLNRVDPALGY